MVLTYLDTVMSILDNAIYRHDFHFEFLIFYNLVKPF